MRRVDILDLVAKHFHSPRIRRLVEFRHNILVNRAALLERAIKIDLANLGSQRSLGQLRDGEHIVADSIGSTLRVKHLQVQNAVNANLYIIPCDADLLGNVSRLFFQCVLVGNLVEKRPKQMESGVECLAELAQSFDHVCVLLRNHNRNLEDDDQGNKCEYQ